MYNFNFDIPTRVLFGPGKLKELHLEALPGKKALIVISSGTSVKKYGYLESLENELKLAGVEYLIFDEIRSNPTNHNVMDGAKIAKENGCDFVIALGGGSVMDCAKCIAIMVTNPGDIWDYFQTGTGGKKDPQIRPIPIVCITTSAGTASEIDYAAVISNDEANEKSGFMTRFIYPTLSIVDADLMMSVPPRLTALQGMDAFFHAAETVVNKNGHPLSELFALKAIEYVAKYLPRAVKDGGDKEARAYVALANTFSGFYMMLTSMHRMEHAMGSFHDSLIHGTGLILIAHEYYDFLAERKAAEEKMIRMAKAMGVENPTSGKDFVSAMDKLIEAVGCGGLKMSDEGISEAELELYPKKMTDIIGGNMLTDPIKLTTEDYMSIFRKAYR